MNRQIAILCVSLICSIATYSQGLNVKEFKQNINDGSAFYAPIDAEGHPCGLIKVRTDNTDLQFNGNIVGNVENKTNEYWVYLTQGSKLLNILHPNYLPLHVDFDAYGIGEVSSKATYVLTLSEQKFKKDKCGLVATVNPEAACVYLNDVFIENLSGNGYYQLYLPKGDYICRIEQKGYRPNVQAISIGKGIQTLDVVLESVLAEIEVKCKTTTAELYIDGEMKGNGSWKGSVCAGEHQIEARQNNYESINQTVIISEKESRTIAIPELKRGVGKLQVETVPKNMPIIVDGKHMGNSPFTIDIESGKHSVSCRTYGCESCRKDIDVKAGDLNKVILPVVFKEGFDKDDYIKAYNGDLSKILFLACERCRFEKNKEALFWISRHPLGENVILEWEKYGQSFEGGRYDFCSWIVTYYEGYGPERALKLYDMLVQDPPKYRSWGESEIESEMCTIGERLLKKKDFDNAKSFFEKAGKYGYEGLGDCYVAKGNKQLATSYYNKYLNIHPYEGNDRDRVLKKLKEIGYQVYL